MRVSSRLVSSILSLAVRKPKSNPPTACRPRSGLGPWLGLVENVPRDPFLPPAACLVLLLMNLLARLLFAAGRTTMPPIMKSGKVDIFAFIGGSTAADALLKQHPTPHRLKSCLSLDAKNLCVVMDDVDVAATVKECITGTLSYNGQRCTALKLLFIHEKIADEFVKLFIEAVDAMKLGLPWEKGVQLTPLPEPNKPKYLQELIEDATGKGAKVVNGLGGLANGPFVRPSVLYPCNKEMRVWKEEQFGPLIPIATFSSFDQCYEYLAESPFGQQVLQAISSKMTGAISASRYSPVSCVPLLSPSRPLSYRPLACLPTW